MKRDDLLAPFLTITDPSALIRVALEYFGDTVLLASSLGAEDQVLTHMMLSEYKRARIFVLDTGRLPQESYNTMETTMQRYGMQYEVCVPPSAELQNMLSKKGPNSFYYSVENRKECCHIRKVVPLKAKLSTAKAWITGLRRDQSENRSDIAHVTWDDSYDMVKFNPLAFWSADQVWEYIREHSIPYNVLHDRGYPSIGCAPCTRAVKPGESIRSGRWWWEDSQNNECGLHVKN